MEVESLTLWEKRPIDLIGHPSMIDKFHHLIHDEILNDHFRRKDPIYAEDDLNEDGTFKDWYPIVDINDPSNVLFQVYPLQKLLL